MLTHYPTKRSVLVPTLLYAQDEAGYLSDEVIAELDSGLGVGLDVGRLVVGVKGFHMMRLIAAAVSTLRSR